MGICAVFIHAKRMVSVRKLVGDVTAHATLWLRQPARHPHILVLEYLFAERKSVLITFDAQGFRQLRWPTIENGNFALFLHLDLFEHFVPIGAAGICARLQARDQISLFL